MTKPQPPCSYRDVVVSGHLGYPDLCNLPNGAVLVSTWEGHCLEVHADSGQVTIQPSIGAMEPVCVQSPAATKTQPALCCAATRQIVTDLWELGSSQTTL